MNETVFRERMSGVSLGFAESLVYQVFLGGSAPTHVEQVSLSASEVARANAIGFPHLRSRFVWCRAALRHILGSLLDRAPAEVALCETAAGRPFVRNADLDFNVSHSDDLALIAVLPGRGSVGVDLERIVEISDLQGLASIVCTPREFGQLLRQSDQQLESFYRLWTCKEAYLKGIGSGLSGDSVRVEIGVGNAGRTLRRFAPDGRSFSIATFHPSPGFVAALAVSAECRH
jgi:4'-phosphopantetheinyl transferase